MLAANIAVAVCTGVLAIATALMAWKTWQAAQKTAAMAEATKEMADATQDATKLAGEQLQLMIDEADEAAAASVRVEMTWDSVTHDNIILGLHLCNTGPGTARNLKVYAWLASDEHDSNLAYESWTCAMLPRDERLDGALTFHGQDFSAVSRGPAHLKLLVTWRDEKRRPWGWIVGARYFSELAKGDGSFRYYPKEYCGKQLSADDPLVDPQSNQSKRHDIVRRRLSDWGQTLASLRDEHSSE